ncbi:MAG: GAF domain-containing protein [Chloroflexota bacterium]
MMTFLDHLFTIERYTGRATKQQARLLYSFTLILMVLFVLYALFVTQENTSVTLSRLALSDPGALLAIISLLAVGVLTLFGIRSGRADLSAAGPIVMWYFSGVLLGFQGRFSTSDEGAALLVLVFLSGLFLRARGVLIGTLIALITLAVAALNNPANNPNYGNVVAGLALQVMGVAALIYLFLRSTRLDQMKAPEQDDARFRLANVTTQIAQRISRRAGLSDLLNNTVEDIHSSYGDIYHVQIFLTDERDEAAALAASTGEVGKLLLQRQHSLPVGSRSVVGTVTQMGQPVIARAGAADSLHRHNEFLPDTLVEAGFPLKIGDSVIGVLDLQSRLSDAFAEEDVPIFQSLADSVAVAIDNARLFEQTEQRLQENQGLVEQMRAAMSEVERLNRSLTQSVWTQYLGNKGEQLSVDVDFSTHIVGRSGGSTPTLSAAMETNQLVQKPSRDGVIVSMPLRVRGLVVGAMEFELQGEALAPEDASLVQAVAERFGLAVESTRLYEESRRVAQRETMLNEIGSRLQRTNSINAVLTEAARGLQTTLGANRVAIRLGAPPGVSSQALENGGES